MKIAYFENQLTTIRMEPNSPTFGKVEMKSKEMVSYSRSGIGKGSKSPMASTFPPYLVHI